ncbi:MAG: PDZ domain-containing protein [Thermoguttaceae bacterium]
MSGIRAWQINASRAAAIFVLTVVACSAAVRGIAADETTAEEQAFAAAVDRVASSVVQIETTGGREQVEGLLLGTGPTTGLVVDPQGYIISSAFNFIGNPASILVRLPSGKRMAARLVATDHARMLVLLKVDVDRPLPVCEVAPRNQMRVGQWAIAVGRTFAGDRPNMAVGILSALDRISGRAIQTDAAVSPNNYGGPLVDIQGRVMGVLVPLSAQPGGQIAGMELYDSGIGFAIPAEDLQRVLPRLKKGEDLHPGLAGVSIQGANQFTAPPIVAACRAKSPAALAGIKPGDRIVELGGRPISRAIQVRDELGRCYAGDKLSVVVLRGKQRIASDLALVEKLEPHQHGFLGVLPMRSETDEGVAVRYVYPGSPAAAAGVAAGDVLVSLAGESIHDRLELMQTIGMSEPGAEIALEVRRSGALRKLKATLVATPEELPPVDLPAAHENVKSHAVERPAVGAVRLKIPEHNNKVWSYVPTGYDPEIPYGVLVWLHPPGGYEWEELLARWKPLCDKHDLILVAPKSTTQSRWMPEEAMLVDRLLMQVGMTYNVDPARIVVHGYEGGGAMAFLTAFRNRQMIRAVAAVEAVPVGSAPDNDPQFRFSVYLASAEKSPSARSVRQAVASLRKKKIPVVTKGLGETPRYLSDEELSELVRWIDMLDRM